MTIGELAKAIGPEVMAKMCHDGREWAEANPEADIEEISPSWAYWILRRAPHLNAKERALLINKVLLESGMASLTLCDAPHLSEAEREPLIAVVADDPGMAGLVICLAPHLTAKEISRLWRSS